MNIKKIRRHVKRILIIYWGFFGDLLTTTPFLEAIRKGFPRAHISYVIGGTGDKEQPDSDPRKIFEHNPNVDKCIRSDASILTRLLTDEPYNFTIDLCGSRTSQLIAKASGAKVKLWGNFRPKIPYFLYSDCLSGQWRPFLKIPIRQNIYKKKDLYRGEPFLEVLRFLRLHFKGAFTPKIYLSREEIYFSKQYLKKIKDKKADIVIGIHPGGRHRHRLWNIKNYAVLADSLIKKYNAKVIVFYGFREKHFANRICRFAHHELFRVFEKDIRKYISIISVCDLFISTDGGPLHIALSSGVPSIGIFKNRENAIYWYNCKKRKNLFSVFVKSNRHSKKQVELVLDKAEQAIGFKNL